MVMVSGGSDPELRKVVKKGTRWNVIGVIIGLLGIAITIFLAIYL